MYCEIVKERPSVAEHVTIRKNTSVKKAEIFPRNDTTVFAAPAEKRSNAVQAGPVDVPLSRTGCQGFGDQKFAEEISKITCQEADRKPSGFFDKTADEIEADSRTLFCPVQRTLLELVLVLCV